MPITLFSVSTQTFTTDIQFNNFSLENLSIINSGIESSLQLNNQFSTLTLVNFPPARYSYGMDCSTMANKLFLFGGRDTTGRRNDSWIFDYLKNSWEQVFPSTNPAARQGHCVVNCGDKNFFIFGGLGADSVYFNNNYIYNLSQNNF
ncbi:MAG: kelch repeat-containing protein, partial [Endomicrobiia bacterium]